MNLRVFERMSEGKRNTGKSYVMFVGVKELAVPFCFLAKKNGFTLDGVVPISQTPNPPPILPQDFSGVPLVDPSRPPFTPTLCFVILAVPDQSLQALWQSLAGSGFGSAFRLTNEDVTEMFGALQYENFIVETVRSELKSNPLDRVLIFDRGARVQSIRNTLSMSGMPIDEIIQSLGQATADSLVIMPIENAQQQVEIQSLKSGKILPLYAGGLLAAEQYWNAHQMFYKYFDLDNVPDFVAKFERRIDHVLNAYDGVNVSVLNVESDDEIAKACALSMAAIDKKILHVVLPINASNSQLNYAAGAGNFLLKKLSARLEVLTPESREFWRYFIKRQPSSVTYSRSVYNYYADRYRNESLKIDSDLSTFTDAERSEVCRARASKFLPEEISTQLATARVMVSNLLSDRWLAMVYGVPIVLINMPTYTLDEKLIVRSDKTPMLMLPKLFVHEPSRTLLQLRNVLNFEEQMPDFDMRNQFFSRNKIVLLDNPPPVIIAAINEMMLRLAKRFEYRGEEKYIDKTVRRLLEGTKKALPRDVIDAPISIEFLKGNRAMLGALQMRTNDFALKNILPAPASMRKKLKVRAFFQRHWNALRTVCEACLADDDIELLIVTDTEEQRDKFVSYGYKCLFKNDYDVASDKPDVFFINYFHDGRNIPGAVRANTRLIIAASQTLVPYQSVVKDYVGDGFNQFIGFIERYWGQYNPDYYMFESYMYNNFKNINFFKGKTVLEMSNPKYDGIYRACHNIRAVDGWEKLDGKQVILWAADHGAWEAGMGDYVSFDFYAKHMFEYMQSHLNMAMIFRPHPLLITELKTHFWTDDDLYAFRNYCSESSNVIFDETDEYDNAFALADAIITDIDCGIRMSALPMMKPICLSYRAPDVLDHYEDLTDYCYRVHTLDEMTDFLDMIGRGDDPLHDIRERAARRHVKHFDGKNGWRIKEFIKQAFKEKFGSETRDV